MSRQPKTASEWNRAYPIGTKVRFEKHPGDWIETTTRGHAWPLSTGRAVVPLNGIKGSVLIEKLTAIVEVKP